jgi:hypothetical protein
MRTTDIVIALGFIFGPPITWFLLRAMLPKNTDEDHNRRESRIKTGQQIIGFISVLISLPPMMGMWSEHFVFADNGPRTQRGWIYFALYAGWMVATMAAMQFWKRKVENAANQI